MPPQRYPNMTFEHLQPPRHIIDSSQKILFGNPFSTKVALLLTLIHAAVITLMLAIANLKWGPAAANYWAQQLLLLGHNLILSGLVFGLSFRVYGRCLKLVDPARSAARYIAYASVGSLLLMLAFSMLTHWLRRTVFNDLDTLGVIDIATLADALLTAGAVLIATLIFTLSRRQKMLLANQQLQTERLLARCEALEKQVNPHFLFNSLNTLGGLIGIDDDSAQHYLQQLASTYRYIMQQHDTHTVTLADELAFVDTYCQMMQTRHGGNLRIVRRIDPALLQRLVPPISVQLLVENAIKHNVVSHRHPLTITIETPGPDRLRVSNPLQPKQDPPEGSASPHIGLDNLNQRYKLLFHKEISIQQTPTAFAVELPLIA